MARKRDAQEAPNETAYKGRFGNIKVAVWPNQKDNGQVWFNTTIVRSYRNGAKWEDTTSFSRDDLPMVIMAAVAAFFWIWNPLGTPRQEQETEA